MDEELKQYLSAMEHRLEGKIDAAAEGVRRDLTTYVDQRVEKTETAVLTEFAKWAEGNHTRIDQGR